MGVSSVGSVVLVKFPYSDLTRYKLRPAVVVAQAEFGNLILCQITSQAYSSKRTIVIKSANFKQGKLPVDSYIRPDKIFTANKKLVTNNLGSLTQETIVTIKSRLKALFA